MRSVFFVERSGIFYYGGNVHAVVFFPYPQGVVTDLEIVNAEDLRTQLHNWIKTNKIEPTLCAILFASNSTFLKEIPLTEPLEKREELKKTFVDLVPFNETLFAEYTFDKSIIVAVVNKRLTIILRDIIQEAGFSVENIAPAAALYGASQLNGFDANTAQDVLKKASVLKAGAFSLIEKEVGEESSGEGAPVAKNNKRLYLLVGLFVVLIGILVIVYFTMMPKATPPRNKVVRRPPLATPQVVVTQSISTESASLDSNKQTSASKTQASKADLKIRVLNGSGIAGQADTIRSRLQEKSYVTIETGNAPTLQTAKTLLIFKTDVGEKERKEILNILEFYFESVSVQEKNDIDSDVLITTSQSVISPTP